MFVWIDTSISQGQYQNEIARSHSSICLVYKKQTKCFPEDYYCTSPSGVWENLIRSTSSSMVSITGLFKNFCLSTVYVAVRKNLQVSSSAFLLYQLATVTYLWAQIWSSLSVSTSLAPLPRCDHLGSLLNVPSDEQSLYCGSEGACGIAWLNTSQFLFFSQKLIFSWFMKFTLYTHTSCYWPMYSVVQWAESWSTSSAMLTCKSHFPKESTNPTLIFLLCSAGYVYIFSPCTAFWKLLPGWNTGYCRAPLFLLFHGCLLSNF